MGLVRRLIFLLVLVNTIFVAAMVFLKRNMPSLGDEDSDEIALVAIMDGLALRSRAQAFRGGSSLVVAGAQVIDLRNAQLAPRGATLQLRTVMGATSVVVPRHWKLDVSGQGAMGVFEDRTKRPTAAANLAPAATASDETVELVAAPDAGDEADGRTMRIEGLAAMGQIVIDYEPAFAIDSATTDGGDVVHVAPTVV